MNGMATEPGRTSPPVEDDARELVETLEDIERHLSALLQISERKLEAMRRADVHALGQCALDEERELQRLLRHDGRRETVLARLAQALRVFGPAPARLSAIAARLSPPYSTQILAKSTVLRDRAKKLEEKSRLAAAVAQSVQSHIRSVFAEIAKANQESVGYGRHGQPASVTTRPWVDAVG